MTESERTVVVALGGNAISPADDEGDIPQQFETTRQTAVHLVDLVERGLHLLITHGNGPQVGNALRRVELAAHEVYRLPLDICVADTQGGMGYMIAQCLNNELRRRGLPQRASALVTAVEVDLADPAFQDPTKPIGGHYSPQQAEQMQRRYGWKMVAQPANGTLRRVVPSPLPKAIVEIGLIRRLAEAGELLVAGGGGGVPVIRNEDGDYVGVEAVIDKDRTSALLASAIGARLFVSATSVRKVMLNFGTPDQRPIDEMTVSQARQHLAAGQFPPGSMGPKIEAALDYLERVADPAARALICDLDRLGEAVAGRDGTWIRPD